MNIWRIPVTWECFGVVEIQANTLEEAMEIARDDDTVPLPTKSSYVDGSWQLSHNDESVVRACYNHGQPDGEFTI